MKIKKVTVNDPVERLAVSVRQSVMKSLEAYRDFYKMTYGEEIERSQLVEQILREFISSDKDFQKHLQMQPCEAQTATPATNSSPE